MEYALTNNCTIKGEYLYYHLGDQSYADYGKSVTFPLSGYAEQIDPRVNSVVVGLAYKF